MKVVDELRRGLLAVLCVGAFAPAWAQPAPALAPLSRFVGNWAGSATGQSAEGTVQRSYEWVMQGRYLREVNISRYPAREAGKSDEVHEHWSMFSFDKARQTIVLRQFHVEGFVNTYRLAGAPGDTPLVFDSEAFENFSNSWKARESYEFVSDESSSRPLSWRRPASRSRSTAATGSSASRSSRDASTICQRDGGSGT